MGLFFDVLSSINNPNQQGSVAQLEGIMNTVQQLGKTQGLGPDKMQSVLAAAGGLLGTTMQARQGGLPAEGQLGNLLNQITGTGAPATALASLFPPQVQQQMIQGIAQQTGVNASTIQGMLPTLLPAVMGLLNMGNSGQGGANSLLTSFLSGNNDLGEVFQFANRFLNPA